MANSFTAPTTYFLQEGRENLDDCLKIAFQAAAAHDVRTIVSFTSYGDGVKLALDSFCSRDEFAQIRLVAVTFPVGKHFTNTNSEPVRVQIADDLLASFAERRVPIVRAHLPFDVIEPSAAWGTVAGRGLNLLGETLSMFGGSMSLCVQAVTLACDAGHVDEGEHVIAMTSDTAILAMATVTRKMLSELVVREILCKPAVFTIGRKEQKAIRAPKSNLEIEGSKPRRLKP